MIVPAGLLLLLGALGIGLPQVMRAKMVTEDQGRSVALHAHRFDAGDRAVTGTTRARAAQLRGEAIRLLLELPHAQGHEEVVLQARLSALFRDWGRHDIDNAERFLAEEDAAQEPFDGFRKYHEDLILAAWIGLSEVDPANAWDRYVGMWERRVGEWAINASWLSSPYDITGFHLFRAYHEHDPAAALRWLRIRDRLNPPMGGILRALMSETADPETRRRYFIEFCENQSAVAIGLGLICAGVAEHDPAQAWEFAHWGKTQEDGLLASESPASVIYDMIRSWSISEPERALEFIVSPEHEKYRFSWIEMFTWIVRVNRPDMVIRALEKNELSALRERFSMTTFIATMVEAGTGWPLVAEDVQPSPEERILMVREALENSDLPASLKGDFHQAIKAHLDPS